jgi:predicted transcriptional regulator
MDDLIKDVSDAELAVLRVLWDDGPATIRQITDRIYPNGTAAHYGTVQKLLERLEAKGHVGRDRRAMAHVFAAWTDRDALIGRRLRETAEKLCDGSLTPLLTHLLKVERLSPKERQELRALMDEAPPPPEPRRDPR